MHDYLGNGVFHDTRSRIPGILLCCQLLSSKQMEELILGLGLNTLRLPVMAWSPGGSGRGVYTPYLLSNSVKIHVLVVPIL